MAGILDEVIKDPGSFADLSSDHPLLVRLKVKSEYLDVVQYEGLAGIRNVDSETYGPAGYGDASVSYMCLDDYGKYRLGNYASAYASLCDAEALTGDDLRAAQTKLDAFMDVHKNAPFKVVTRLYGETPSYMGWDVHKQFPSYKEIDGSVKAITLNTDKVRSLDDAKLWLLKNQPDRYMGASIARDCPSGDFCMTAVPCAEYPEGTYETQQARTAYAKDLYDQMTGAKDRRGRRLPDVGYDSGSEAEMDYGTDP